MELVPQRVARAPELFGVPHPSRDDPNIQSIVYAKTEYRECASGPNPYEDVRVSDIFYNSQVLFQRLLSTYGSMMLLFEQSAGKTGCIKCYQDYIKNESSETISKFYYVSAELQGKEFEEQIVGTFGTDEDKVNLARGAPSRKTVLRRAMAKEKIKLMTYGNMSKLIATFDNTEDLVQHFCSACVVIDEFHTIKLNDTKDIAGNRPRLELYKQYWRLFRLVPTCVCVLATGTYVTDDITEFIYSLNLMPNTKQILTQVSLSIAQAVSKDYGISLDSLGLGEGVHGYNWVEDFDMIGPENNEDASEEEVDKFREKRERQLEPVIRGRVMYARAPKTKATVSYLTGAEAKMLNKKYNTNEFDQSAGNIVTNWRCVSEDTEIDKTVTSVYMSMFQTLGFLHSVVYGTEGWYVEASQACVFVFPTEEYAEDCMELGISDANKKHMPTHNFGTSYGGLGYEMCFDYVETSVTTRNPKTANYLKRTKDVKTVVVRKPFRWFEDYLSRDDCLHNSGIIVWDIVWLSTRENGFPVYVPSRFLHSVLYVILEALKLRGFVEYKGNETLNSEGLPARKRNRVALISQDNVKTFQNILRLYGHPANVRGEYIKTLLVSPVGTTGLNIPNVGNCCITEPQHNSAETRQATSRCIRPNSHFESLKLVAGEPWEWKTFPVYFHYYIPILYGVNSNEYDELKSVVDTGQRHLMSKLKEDSTSSHWKMYSGSYSKDIIEAGLAHSIKRCAIDYQINIERNIRPDIIDYSFKADYLPSHYTAYNCDTTLPIDMSTYESYYLSSKKLWNSRYLLNVISTSAYVTTDQIVDIVKKSGMIYAKQEVLYSLRRLVETQKVIGTDYLGFPLVLQEDKGVFYPTSDYVQTPSSTLISYSQAKTFKQSFTVDEKIAEYLDDSELEYYKDLIHNAEEYRTTLTDVPNPYKCALLEEALTNMMADNVQEEWETKVIAAYQLLTAVVSDPESTSPEEYVVVHQVDILFSGTGSNYVAVDNVVNVKKRLRMYVHSHSVNQSNAWRACTSAENMHYSQFLHEKIESHLQKYYARFSHIEFIGVIVRPDKVHIRQFEVVKTKAGKKAPVVYKSKGKGQDTDSIRLKDLLRMLYVVSPEEHDVKVSNEKRKALLSYFAKTLVGDKILDSKMIAKLPSAQLFFYEQKLIEQSTPASKFPTDAPKRSLPYQLRIKLFHMNAIFAVVGDVKNVVMRTD